MSPVFLFLVFPFFVVNGEHSKHVYNSTTCDNFQASFDIRKVVGAWYVVAIIPDKQFPEQDVSCSKIELSETDGASLQWLIKKTKAQEDAVTKLNGEITTIRQRYHTEQPYDVWSKSVGISGCFQQVMSLDAGVNETQKVVTHSMMQLHLVESNKKSDPFLLQMLWGRVISAVIYRKQRDVTQEQLKPVFELLSNLRGPQRLPKICKEPLRDLFY